MGNWWLNRLVVCGPAKDVAAFRRAAIVDRTGGSAREILSFERLIAGLPKGAAVEEDNIPHPADLSVDPIKKLNNGMAELVYQFQLKSGELESVLAALSPFHPNLSFTLVWVDPASDGGGSCFVHAGRIRTRNLSRTEQARIRAKVPEDTGENNDEILRASIECDWETLDFLTAHWSHTIEKTLQAVDRRVSAGSAPPRTRVGRTKGMHATSRRTRRA